MPNRHQGPPAERRALDTLVKLSRALESVAGRLNQALDAEGLTPGQLAVLEALFHLGPLTQNVLASKLLRSAPNITTVLANLERDGHVKRAALENDRRSRRVSLTPEGRRLIARIFPKHARRVAALMGVLDADEQETLAALCRKLGRGVSQGEQSPARGRRD
jgi:MarR family 2-MHQ and catechol resistance regulon transcriptional repressor